MKNSVSILLKTLMVVIFTIFLTSCEKEEEVVPQQLQQFKGEIVSFYVDSLKETSWIFTEKMQTKEVVSKTIIVFNYDCSIVDVYEKIDTVDVYIKTFDCIIASDTISFYEADTLVSENKITSFNDEESLCIRLLYNDFTYCYEYYYF